MASSGTNDSGNDKSWLNTPIEIISGTPEDVSGLRSSLIEFLTSASATGATPYTGAVSAHMDPLQTMASNILTQQMYGTNYTGPNYGYSSGTSAGISGINPGTGSGTPYGDTSNGKSTVGGTDSGGVNPRFNRRIY